MPEVTLTKISGRVYSVTVCYDGIKLPDRKLERIMEQNMIRPVVLILPEAGQCGFFAAGLAQDIAKMAFSGYTITNI